MLKSVKITTEFIRLDNLLKITGEVMTKDVTQNQILEYATAFENKMAKKSAGEE